MSGAYAGGSYRDLGTDADAGIDWNAPGGNAGQPYRPGTGVAAGKPNQHSDGIPRGAFDVQINHVVGWNDASDTSSDWYNYTRVFPSPAQDYNIIGRLSSGGNPINGQIDQIPAGVKTANQTLKKVGVFKPGRATAGWDIMEWFPLTDDAGKTGTTSIGGEYSFRFSTLNGANLDIDSFMFVPLAGAPAPGTTPGTKIAAERTAAGLKLTFSGTLQSADSVTGPWTDVAGATSPRDIPFSGGGKFYRSKQ